MAVRGDKIGEARVDLTANDAGLDAGLRSGEQKVQTWAQRVTGVVKGVGAAIATAYAALRSGVAIGEFIRDIREANIVLNDFRRGTLSEFVGMMKQTQNLKINLQTGDLQKQMEMLGMTASNIDALIDQMRTEGSKSIREAAQASTDSMLGRMEKDLSDWQNNLFNFLQGTTNEDIGKETEDWLNRVFGFRLTEKTLGEIRKQYKASIDGIAEQTRQQLQILEQQIDRIRAEQTDAMNRQIFDFQNRQRGGFGLGQEAVDPTVLARELSRIYSQSRY